MINQDADLSGLGTDLVVEAARVVRAVRAHGDLPAGFRVLSMLDEHGPVGVSRLAQLDQCSQPSMSGTVTGLAERGWVRKQAHPDDARTAVVHLTEIGSAALAAGRSRIGEQVGRRLATTSHSAQDVATAVAVLRDLTGKGEQ